MMDMAALKSAIQQSAADLAACHTVNHTIDNLPVFRLFPLPDVFKQPDILPEQIYFCTLQNQ